MGYHKISTVDQAIINIKKQFSVYDSFESFFEYFNDKKNNRMKEGILIISEQDSKLLKKDFMPLSLNRFRLGESKLVAKNAL